MSRTVQDIKVIGKKPDDVQEYIIDWFSDNGFSVEEWDSKGKPLWARSTPVASIPSVTTRYPSVVPIMARIRPKAGSIVAVNTIQDGCVVFEITLKREGYGDTLVHGEFYTAGWHIFLGKELDLREHGGGARERGSDLLDSFIDSLSDFSLSKSL